MKAVKLGRGCATISTSPGYRFGYLLDWQNQSDAVSHSEFSSEASQSSFGLKASLSPTAITRRLEDDQIATPGGYYLR